MMFSKRIIIFTLTVALFFTNSSFCSAQSSENDNYEKKYLFPALLGGIFSNTVFHMAGRIFGADFAQTTPESIKTNLTSTWVWDNDAFLFNHPGHPYQGGLYNAAARSSGFSFYEAVFFNGFGSLAWELFGEIETPSLNDLVVTTSGGAAFGEMLYLLFLETNSPVAAIFVSPMASLNHAILKNKPKRTQNLHYFSVMSGSGWIQSVKDDTQLENSPYIFTVNLGCEVIYGDPFIQNSRKPYSQFEIKMQFGGFFYPLWLDWTILTDGYLISFNPIHTEKNKLSTGLTLHYDLITGNSTHFASNALDWTLKWKHSFTSGWIELKSHFGWTFIGSSEYEPLLEINDTYSEPYEHENNYGTGGNIKLFFTLQNDKHGKLTLGLCNYLLYIFPWHNQGPRGIEFFNISFFEYSYNFTEQFSITVNNTLYFKNGTSQEKTKGITIANRVILGIQWTFLNKN